MYYLFSERRRWFDEIEAKSNFRFEYKGRYEGALATAAMGGG